MPRFGDYGPDTVIDGTELLILRSEDGNTRYTTVDTVAEYAVGSPGGGTPPVVIELATETASFALSQATHAARRIWCDSASAIVVTVPENATSAVDVGCVFEFVRWNTGAVSFVEGSGTVEVYSEGGRISASGLDAIAAQYRSASLVKKATNVWHLDGYLT